LRSLHFLNVIGLSGLGEKRLLRTVEAEDDEEAFVGKRGKVDCVVRHGKQFASLFAPGLSFWQ
jgi:hypothetical protein